MINMRLFISFVLWLRALVYGLDLVGDYRFWHSISDTMIYDYSGNSLHASLQQFIANAAYYTDRGLYIQNKCLVNLPSNEYNLFPAYSDIVISFWYYSLSSKGHRLLCIQETNKAIKVVLDTSSLNTHLLQLWDKNNNIPYKTSTLTIGNI
jgi:hypothetical protein